MSDTGTGYGRPRPTSLRELTEVGPGTPMGELLRRYWHPVGLGGDAAATPRAVRVLGEDLILFRDGHGRAGLVVARCAHRGTTLYYGRVEERGIRCCYHGWLFDVHGHCLEQPCEPGGGTQREPMRQPWYPVQEEHLVSSDRGLALVRRQLKRQLEVIADGKDPAGVSLDATAPPIVLEAGNFCMRAADRLLRALPVVLVLVAPAAAQSSEDAVAAATRPFTQHVNLERGRSWAGAPTAGG